jgi:hypothetical protein
MTAITYVSQKEMKKRTGLSTALGYSLPEEDEILVRKGLDPELKKEVLAHEEEHILKGEEGPGLGSFFKKALNLIPVVGPIISTAATLIGGSKSAGAQKDAARTAAAGSERELEFNRESRDLARADQAPYVSAGHTALSALMDMTGLGAGSGGGAQAAPQAGFGPRYGGGPYNRYTNYDGTGRLPPSGSGPGRYRRSAYELPRYDGGPTGGGATYNVNELGPENRYSGGAMRRNPNPMTIDGETGYVRLWRLYQ